MMELILAQLERIENRLDSLVEQRATQDWYDTRTAGELLSLIHI